MERKDRIDALGGAVLLGFSLLVGLNQVLIKLVNAGMSPVFQAGLRSACAFLPVLAFAILMRTGIHPPEIRAVNVDFDWTYRRLLPRLIGRASVAVASIWAAQTAFWMRRANDIVARLYRGHGPEGRLAGVWPTGSMVIWIAVLLSATLIISFLG